MNGLSDKWRERLLYLISPIALLLVWQMLVGMGFGDRRFIPTPSDIAARFWQLTVSGELAVNTLATLWRVVAGSGWDCRSRSCWPRASILWPQSTRSLSNRISP